MRADRSQAEPFEFRRVRRIAGQRLQAVPVQKENGPRRTARPRRFKNIRRFAGDVDRLPTRHETIFRKELR